MIGADAGTYSITAVVDRADKELRAHLMDSDRFDATMRLLPELADVPRPTASRSTRCTA